MQQRKNLDKSVDIDGLVRINETEIIYINFPSSHGHEGDHNIYTLNLKNIYNDSLDFVNINSK